MKGVERIASNVWRIEVPGGWTYAFADETGTRVACYVPAPRRLVQLLGDSGQPHLVSPDSVMGILTRDAGQPTEGAEIWCGPHGILHVQGTPAEVAAKLGFEVS
jgi:hypothetical protein